MLTKGQEARRKHRQAFYATLQAQGWTADAVRRAYHQQEVQAMRRQELPQTQRQGRLTRYNEVKRQIRHHETAQQAGITEHECLKHDGDPFFQRPVMAEKIRTHGKELEPLYREKDVLSAQLTQDTREAKAATRQQHTATRHASLLDLLAAIRHHLTIVAADEDRARSAGVPLPTIVEVGALRLYAESLAYGLTRSGGSW